MHRSILVAAALAAISPSSPAQRNATLLGSFDPGHDSNDVWGYRNPANGKEYALFLTERGTYVMDCTTGMPQQRAFISGPTSIWRDAKTFRHYAYVVTEGGGGMQIINLQDPDNPVLVRTWGTGNWSNAHNIYIDTENGIAYPCGTNRGVPIVDLNADPENPTLIGNFNRFYVHDLQVQHGWAYLCDLYANKIAIARTQDLASNVITGTTAAPGARYFHNVWGNRLDTYAVGTNEEQGGPVSIWDVRNKALPVLVGQIHPAPGTALPHNAHVLDEVSHTSYYTEGYVAIDFTNPTLPLVVAQYDTYPGISRGYNGAWGCYPFQPSGTVYISDIQTGLYVVSTPATAAFYGDTTAGGSGNRPGIHGFGAPFLGNSRYRVDVSGAAASAPGVLLINTARASLNVAGLQINVDPFGGTPLMVSINTDANGDASVSLGVPHVQAYVGTRLAFQAFVFDLGGPFNLSATQGMEIELFGL